MVYLAPSDYQPCCTPALAAHTTLSFPSVAALWQAWATTHDVKPASAQSTRRPVVCCPGRANAGTSPMTVTCLNALCLPAARALTPAACDGIAGGIRNAGRAGAARAGPQDPRRRRAGARAVRLHFAHLQHVCQLFRHLDLMPAQAFDSLYSSSTMSQRDGMQAVRRHLEYDQRLQREGVFVCRGHPDMNSLVGLGAATSFTAGAAAMLVRRHSNTCGLTAVSKGAPRNRRQCRFSLRRIVCSSVWYSALDGRIQAQILLSGLPIMPGIQLL